MRETRIPGGTEYPINSLLPDNRLILSQNFKIGRGRGQLGPGALPATGRPGEEIGLPLFSESSRVHDDPFPRGKQAGPEEKVKERKGVAPDLILFPGDPDLPLPAIPGHQSHLPDPVSLIRSPQSKQTFALKGSDLPPGDSGGPFGGKFQGRRNGILTDLPYAIIVSDSDTKGKVMLI